MPDLALQRSDDVIRQLVDMRKPSTAAVSSRGEIAFVVTDAGPADPFSGNPELWIADPGESARHVPLDASPSSGTLAWSPRGGELAYAIGVEGARSALRLWDGSSSTREVAVLEGTVIEVRWSRDGRELLALVLDAGGNTAEPAWGSPRAGHYSQAQVMTPTGGLRRLVRINLENGLRQEPRPGPTVWEFGWTGGDRAVVMVTHGTGENDWYFPRLALLDLPTGSLTTIHDTDVQLTSVTMAPDGARAAFVEGKASDRGLVAGGVRVVGLADGTVSPQSATQDITSIDWLDDDTLYYARWDDLGSAVGRIDIRAGTEAELWRGPATLGVSFRPSMQVGGGIGASVIQAFHEAPEIATIALDDPAAGWTKRTDINEQLDDRDYFSIREIAWEGADGLEIHGLLLEPDVEHRRAVVAVGHGGPTIAWSHSFEPSHGQATVLAAAGFPVLLANPRGSTGRGPEFVRGNLKDLGGLDYQDITTGVDRCRQELFGSRDVPAGFVGVSYAGFLACWAAAKADCFSSVVAVSTISNWTSFLYGSVNGGFAWGHLGPDDRQAPPIPPEIFWERSPIAHVGAHSAPTLIVHGELDYCTPIGQGFEFFNALRWAGVDTEFVAYPNEGHWPVARANQIDIHRRTRRWIAQYLLESPPAELVAAD